VIVLCSTCFEGFPTVLVEAMRQGKPIVCSRIGGLGEIVDDGVTGFLFKPGDAADFADKLRKLWQQPGLCRAMGEAGRAKALREYSSQHYYELLMKVYGEAQRRVSAPRRAMIPQPI
jgi:glycosyltransferase involved in cell wall biosynthesis